MRVTKEIPFEAVSELSDLFAKITKKANKLGVQAPRATFGAERHERRTVMVEGQRVEEVTTFVEVTIEGVTPKMPGGWHLVGQLEGGFTVDNQPVLIVREIPGQVVPEQYRTGSIKCDHCQHNRYRKKGYVLRSEQGEYREVGSTCLQDFLGGMSPAEAIALAEAIFGMDGAISEVGAQSGVGGVRMPTFYDTLSVLKMTAVSIRERGWLSSTKARDTGGVSTADLVRDALLRLFGFRGHGPVYCPTEADTALAQAALDWAKNLVPQNNYEHNINTFARAGECRFKDFGFVCSILVAYNKVPQASVESQAVSTHQGIVGEDLAFTGTIEACIPMQGQFGGWCIVFKDAMGNAIKWFASRRGEAAKGQYVSVVGKVKSHGNYRGVNETIITRAWVRELAAV